MIQLLSHSSVIDSPVYSRSFNASKTTKFSIELIANNEISAAKSTGILEGSLNGNTWVEIVSLETSNDLDITQTDGGVFETLYTNLRFKLVSTSENTLVNVFMEYRI
jgi:hypothetical protein